MPPPPLPPVVIPQGNNPIPSAVASPFTGNSAGGMASPAGTPRRAAPEPNKRALYVGGLDPRVTEDVLRQIFETAGHVQNVKIIPDKNVSLPVSPHHGGYDPSSFISGSQSQSAPQIADDAVHGVSTLISQYLSQGTLCMNNS
jgi:nucleolysin TIA-1/TIAR